MFKHILIPVDDSHICLQAREVAASIAKRFNSTVATIHVISHEFMHLELKAHQLPRLILPPAVLSEINKFYEEMGDRIIRDTEEFFRKQNIKTKTVLARAEDPAEEILKTAKKLKPDLLVIGNLSEKQAERFALGSVAEKVSLYAKCPVLVAKKKTEIKNILVPIDGSKQAENALDCAAMLCKHFEEARITILHVIDSRLFELQPKYSQEVGRNLLQKALVKAKDISHNTRLEFGDAAITIMKVAKQDDYDLIVLGSRGIGTVKRYLLGSVSADVSMHAQRSVLIVR